MMHDQTNDLQKTTTVIKYRKLVAQLMPVDNIPIDYFGYLKDTVLINQDIIAPIDEHWEATINFSNT